MCKTKRFHSDFMPHVDITTLEVFHTSKEIMKANKQPDHELFPGNITVTNAAEIKKILGRIMRNIWLAELSC